METRNNNIELRYKGDEGFTGYASVFYDGTPGTEYELWQGTFERIDPTAFDDAITNGKDVMAFYEHNSDILLGRTSANTLHLRKDAKGLKYSIPFDANDEDHRRIKAKVDRGDLRGSSFGFVPKEDRWHREGSKDVRTITKLDLVEISIVANPAYKGTEKRSAETSYKIWKQHEETQKRIQMLTPK